MNYKRINDLHHDLMSESINNSLKFEWNDEELINELLGEINNVYLRDNTDSGLSYGINSLINKFNDRQIDCDSFIRELDVLLNKLSLNNISYNTSINYYKYKINNYKKILIEGVGGIGKSYFIYQLENKLKDKSINYLCVYGKYLNRFGVSYINKIIEESKKGEFVFIVDAFNELKSNYQKLIIDNIDRLLSSGTRIIISVRTNSISYNKLNKLRALINNSYDFLGVSYSSAIENLTNSYGMDISKFEEILETNNPLYLKMLLKIIDDKTLVKELVNSNSQITFILEQYIKKTIDIKTWKLTKDVCKYLYLNNVKYFTKDSIKSVLGSDCGNYLKIMQENGFLNNNHDYYYFTMETLCDYLIARYLNDDIDDLDESDKIKLINNKLEHLYSIGEAFILILFDRYYNDVESAINIIKNSDLKDYMDLKIFSRIKFKSDQICVVQNLLKINNNVLNFFEIGGYADKPFNSSNYFNDYFINNPNKLYEFNNSECSNYNTNKVIERIKNGIYYILKSKSDDSKVNELFYFSIWCLISPNDDLRLMATKLLYILCNKYSNYVNEIIFYYKFDDDYLKNSIVYILSSLDSEIINDNIDFFKNILDDYNEINSFRIYLASCVVNKNKYDYVCSSKRNLYLEIKDNKPDEITNSFVREIDLLDKDLLRFSSYSKKDELEINERFLICDKNIVYSWNELVNSEFKCIKDGECMGSFNAFKIVSNSIDLSFELDTISNLDIFLIYQIVLYESFKKYKYNYKHYEERFDSHFNQFNNSLMRKIAIISEQNFMGSLMCNYYTDNFESFNGFQDKVGFSVFDPYEYGFDFNITSPISIYNEDIDHLNSKVLKSLVLLNRDKKWWNDVDNAWNNLFNIIKPIKYKGYDWIIGSIRIHLRNHKKIKMINEEAYNVFLSCDNNAHITSNNDRKYTIEIPEYKGCINNYINSNNNSCCSVNEVYFNSKYFNSTSLVLPPSPIIKLNNLKYNEFDSTWRNKSNEIIIYCNNNVCKYYEDVIVSSSYIRKDIYDSISNKVNFKYFGYTERYLEDKGYNDKVTSLHVEFNNDEIIKYSYNGCQKDVIKIPSKCKKCTKVR